MNDTHDRDALRFTLNWASTHDYAISGSQALLELLPITREYDDLAQRDLALHAAAQRIAGRSELVSAG